ncbi:MAG: alpha/beta hydrolase, partial [Actinobacteria bacterium]|nr:alpha/beta hydrolase [Actinomycetota bacterium]
LVLALTLLVIARGLRVVARRLAALIGRWLPAVVSRLLAVAVVAVAATFVLNGAVVQIGKATLERTFSALDDETFAGNEQPTASERSGSPASLSAWDSLGREGRRFVSTGPTVAQLEAFDESIGLDRTVQEPIRVYAGRTSASDLTGVAANVVAELDRTDAWDRSTLVVTTTTGTGWVDPSSARALELLWGGDTAIAAMQYSYLPSWVSFVGDRTTPGEAGVALLDAVRTRWLELPADHRPQLYVYGISLGSFGSQSAFSSLDDVLARTDGALWVGTPGFTTLWSTLTAERDAGSPQILPVLDDGAHVRWAGVLDADGTELETVGTSWDGPHVVYLQHASDGVVWWSPDLLFSKPDWLREPRGADVLPEVTWTPIVSFWQLTIDLFVAGGAPYGHGHNYAVEYADGWAAVATPDGWTNDDTLALRAVLAARVAA